MKRLLAATLLVIVTPDGQAIFDKIVPSPGLDTTQPVQWLNYRLRCDWPALTDGAYRNVRCIILEGAS